MRNIRCNLTFLFILFCFTFLTAQVKELDEVKLVDQTKYLGTLISQKPGEYIKFVVFESKDTLSINMDQIDEISKVKTPTNTEDKFQQNEPEMTNQINQKHLRTSIHYMEGGGDVRFQGFGLMVGFLNPKGFELGISATYLGETGSSETRSYQWQKIALMLEPSYDLQKYGKHQSAVYFRFGLGYSLTLNGNYFDENLQEHIDISNGLIANPGLGFRYHFTSSMGLKADVSYLFIADQSLRPNGQQLENLNWNMAVLRLSFFF